MNLFTPGSQVGNLPCFREVFSSSVLEAPGSHASDFTLEPRACNCSCRAMAYAELASLLMWYRIQGPALAQPKACLQKLTSSPPRVPTEQRSKKAGLRSKPLMSRAAELWKTTRASPREHAAASSWGINNLVSNACESWFVCICTSKPSAVRTSFIAMTPALLASTSRPPARVAIAPTSSAASRVDAKLWRSSATVRTSVAAGTTARSSASAFAARSDGRFISTTQVAHRRTAASARW
mmetsp:Transcript_45029/g.119145  ORF Transcript_45029/g.119145 Transcript_45029/m.119145 type:complete len:238 (-) Transcript_45029:34-747(-)